ncbi:hypothetical protein L2E82_46957 [Cichorium intybus]|uniref:Uncharacterized protein n=1 Tax=Cichorium intybus TaxID=13427 RepID=A0ACB8YTE8_CICIN|nr:hypothetical protein L2E82_46957 [Cichorium intybus]
MNYQTATHVGRPPTKFNPFSLSLLKSRAGRKTSLLAYRRGAQILTKSRVLDLIAVFQQSELIVAKNDALIPVVLTRMIAVASLAF